MSELKKNTKKLESNEIEKVVKEKEMKNERKL